MEFIRENFGDSVLCQQVIKDLKLELNDLKNENKALKEILQKNGLEAPENDASEESIFQSQTAISAVEMQETINKENLKRNAQKHAGSVDQPEPAQEGAASSDSQAAEAVGGDSAGNKESDGEQAPQVVASETVQEKSLSTQEASAEEQKVVEDKDSAEAKPKEEPAN